jgi:amino acid transporter
MASLVIITLVNLRGVRDTGVVFLFPTYLFVGCLMVAIGLGIWKTIAAAEHPMPVVAPKPLKAARKRRGCG